MDTILEPGDRVIRPGELCEIYNWDGYTATPAWRSYASEFDMTDGDLVIYLEKEQGITDGVFFTRMGVASISMRNVRKV